MVRLMAAALALVAGSAQAGLTNIRFEVKSDACGSVPIADLPSRSYTYSPSISIGRASGATPMAAPT